MLAHDLRDALHVMAHAGRAFGRLHEHGPHVRSQPRPDVVQRKRLAIGSAQHVRVTAKRLGQPRPALAELSRREHQHLIAWRRQIRHRRLHHACARTRQHELKQRLEVGGAVVRRERSHGRLRRRQQRRWPGSKKTVLVQHGHSPSRVGNSLLVYRNGAPRAHCATRLPQPDIITAHPPTYNSRMSLVEQIQKDIVAAMKAKDEPHLSALRMVKSALQLRQVEKMSPLDEKESQAVLATLIKQRKESVEQFTKGGRQEMADKEAAEIVVIESYMPKAASEADIVAGVKAAIAEMASPTMKEMGTVMKNAMARFNAAGMRVDGKMVSEIVKKELAGK